MPKNSEEGFDNDDIYCPRYMSVPVGEYIISRLASYNKLRDRNNYKFC
jgi:hypothetical protein